MPSVEADPNAAGYAWSAFLTKGENHKRHNENHKKAQENESFALFGLPFVPFVYVPGCNRELLDGS